MSDQITSRVIVDGVDVARHRTPDLALRVIDGTGREWAPKLNGSWACLGYNLTAASLRDLDERFIVAAES